VSYFPPAAATWSMAGSSGRVRQVAEQTGVPIVAVRLGARSIEPNCSRAERAIDAEFPGQNRGEPHSAG